MPKPSEQTNFSRLRSIFFFGLIALLLVGFLYIIRPFFYPIFWAAIIAILFYPIHKKLRDGLKLPRLSALMTVILALVTIAVPLSVITLLLFQQSAALYESISNGSLYANIQTLNRWIEQTAFAPYIAGAKEQWTVYAADATRAISIFLFNNIKAITENSIRFVFYLFIMLYTLFYFLKDGGKILRRLQHLSPLLDHHDELLYERFTSTVRATLKGTFIIGGIQATLGGILFWITGIEGALIWGTIMFLLSIIPGFGSFIVWLPAGIILLVLGDIWQGIVILIVGTLVISTIDNLLRPLLVGKDIQMHPLMVLFTTLGGIILFGFPGFIIGPIIAALYLSVMSIYDNYYLHELKHND
ncbi:MAG: AI-2E family transporter [Patescibacteria group bacterium]